MKPMSFESPRLFVHDSAPQLDLAAVACSLRRYSTWHCSGLLALRRYNMYHVYNNMYTRCMHVVSRGHSSLDDVTFLNQFAMVNFNDVHIIDGSRFLYTSAAFVFLSNM